MVAFATQVKRRRGTTAQNDAFTGAEGEIVVDTQKHTLRVHDGVTLGGFEIARQTDLNDKAATSYVDSQLALKANTDLSNVPDNYDYVVESQSPTADNGYTWYRKYKSGWVEQGGITTFAQHGANSSKDNTVSLPVEMADTQYYVSAPTFITDAGNSQTLRNFRNTRSVTTLKIGMYTTNALSNSYNVQWRVSGYAAE